MCCRNFKQSYVDWSTVQESGSNEILIVNCPCDILKEEMKSLIMIDHRAD